MNIYIYISFYLKSLILKNNLNTLDNFHQDKLIHLWKLTQIWINTRLKKVLCFRYGVLLTQRLPVASDREQTVALLDMFCTEEGQYQLGLTKVPPCPVCPHWFWLCVSARFNMCVCVSVVGVPQGASVPAAGGEVEQHPDLGCRHHPEEHKRLPVQEELQVLQTESHRHPEPHQGTPGQVGGAEEQRHKSHH